MKKFPQLSEQQVTLVWAEFKTGQILDGNFAVVTQPGQEPYIIFDDLKTAVDYAKQILKEKSGLECVIYGADEEVLHYVTPQNLKSF